jgi:hypothetical protein
MFNGIPEQAEERRRDDEPIWVELHEPRVSEPRTGPHDGPSP